MPVHQGAHARDALEYFASGGFLSFQSEFRWIEEIVLNRRQFQSSTRFWIPSDRNPLSSLERALIRAESDNLNSLLRMPHKANSESTELFSSEVSEDSIDVLAIAAGLNGTKIKVIEDDTILIEPVQGDLELNGDAYTLKRLFNINTLYSKGRLDQHMTAAVITSPDGQKSLYISESILREGKFPIDALRHEALHLFLDHLIETGVETIFDGYFSKTTSVCIDNIVIDMNDRDFLVPYEDGVHVQELVTFSLALWDASRSLRDNLDDRNSEAFQEAVLEIEHIVRKTYAIHVIQAYLDRFILQFQNQRLSVGVRIPRLGRWVKIEEWNREDQADGLRLVHSSGLLEPRYFYQYHLPNLNHSNFEAFLEATLLRQRLTRQLSHGLALHFRRIERLLRHRTASRAWAEELIKTAEKPRELVLPHIPRQGHLNDELLRMIPGLQ